MKQYVMRYPGDPPMNVYEMTRAEFLLLCPRRPIVLEGWGGPEGYSREEIPVEPDCICCDFCNADPGDTVYAYGNAATGSLSRAYCPKCAKEHWLPYCGAPKEGVLTKKL